MIIDSRFNGPPGTGNGGYTCGRFATAHPGPGPVEVTLRKPPPLDAPLTTTATTDGRIEIRDPDGELIGQVAPADPFTVTIAPVPWAAAVEVSAAYPGFTDHPFPTCYVCGPKRDDGLGVFPGVLPDGRTAAPFVVPEDVSAATVWAALDCPGGWAIITPGRPYVLGRMAATVSAVPAPGDRCVVVGRMVRSEGRKAEVQTMLYGPGGEPLGYARATWIAI
ncbi:MAG TPA: hypothetical protein VF174_06640 [Micromonosporaceae bacterium]